MKKSKTIRRVEPDMFFNIRIPASVYAELQKIAEREERTMAYLARVFIKSGIDDRNRAGGIRANG